MSFLLYLFKTFVSLFNSGSRAKLKITSLVSREIKKNRYSNFYQIITKEAMPFMGMFFFDTYKCVQSYQKTLLKAERSQVLKEIIFHRFLDDKGSEILDKISESYIRELSLSYTVEALAEQVKINVIAAERYFNEAWRTRLDDFHAKIIRFSWFVNFDYAGLLQNFIGLNIPLDVQPNFNKVKIAALAEHLKDFLSVSPIIGDKVDWPLLLNILKQFDVSFPETEKWIRLYPSLIKVIKSGIFVFIIRHHEENPDWEVEELPAHFGFAFEYLGTLTSTAYKVLNDIEKQIKSNMVNQLVRRVFSESMPNSTTYYNDNENELYIAEGYVGFTITKQVNYLLSFFYTYCENIRDLVNSILIKASWTSREISGQLSQAMLGINEKFQNLSDFDKSFTNEGERGMKLRTYLSKATLGKRHGENLVKYFETVNIEARDIVNRTMEIVTVFFKLLSALEHERNSEQQLIIRNWTELEFHLKEHTMSLAECVKKLEDLIALIHYIDSIEIKTESSDKE